MIEVLLADDHKIVREGLRQILGDTGDILVAAEAANGHEVMEHVRARHFDVIVLDLSMPGRSGLDLIKQLRDETPRCRILVLSMHPEEQYAVRAIRAGAAGYLHKDSASDDLVTAIRKVSGGGVYVSAAAADALVRGFMPGVSSAPHTQLSDREYQVFLMIADGVSITDIAQKLSLSVKTVSTHKSRILEKMGVTSAADLIRYAIRHDLAGDPGA